MLSIFIDGTTPSAIAIILYHTVVAPFEIDFYDKNANKKEQLPSMSMYVL